MKKTSINVKRIEGISKKTSSRRDDTEISLSVISKEFKKNVRANAVVIKKMLKIKLNQELAQIEQNYERILHG